MQPFPRLPQDFYARDTLKVARELLGKYLVHEINGTRYAGRISETEAYRGPHDLACHASKGKTARTSVMFGPAGHWYVYLIYGMYHCLNVVTEREEFPAAVLLRGVTPEEGVASGVKTDGPGKLCRAMQIDKAQNTQPGFGQLATLWIEDRGERVSKRDILSTPRIGVNYAGAFKDKPWRFVIPRKK